MPKVAQLATAQLAFANSDLAFQGNHLFLGNFYGLSIYDISNPAKAKLVTTMVCPGGQGDPSVYKNLLFMSVEMPNGLPDCGTQGFPPDLQLRSRLPGKRTSLQHRPRTKHRFRGVRIFDISDIRNPKQVAAVQTCRGSHTHTLVVDPNDQRLHLRLRNVLCPAERRVGRMLGCGAGQRSKHVAFSHRRDQSAARRRPQDAKVVSSPRLFWIRRRARSTPEQRRTHGKDGPVNRRTRTSVTTSPYTQHSDPRRAPVPAMESCLTSRIRQIQNASMR